MKKIIHLFLFIGFYILPLESGYSQGMNPLWKPLVDEYLHADTKPNILEEEIKDGILLQRLYFYSHHIGDSALNVYAVYARPIKQEGAKLPGLVHVHGGGGTAAEEIALFHASRGYAVVSYDWTGVKPFRDSLRVTHFPEGLAKHSDFTENPNEHKFYHTIFMVRRAISFLTQKSEVNNKRIGLVGESWGGAHTFRVNAMEDRLAVATPIYGVYDKQFLSKGNPKWLERYGTMNYVAEQKAPLFLFNPTNDFSHDYHFDNAQAYMKELRVDNRQVWLANEDHGVRPKPLAAMYRFMDHYLKDMPALPPTPSIYYEESESALHVSIDARGAETVKLFYSYGNKNRPSGGVWLPIQSTALGDGKFAVTLPLPEGIHDARFYAQASYEKAFELSSLAAHHFIGNKRDTQKIATSKTLYEPTTMGIYPWFFRWTSNGHGNYTPKTLVKVRPSIKDQRMCLVQEHLRPFNFSDPHRRPGFHFGNLRTPACPQRKAGAKDQLQIEFYCPVDATISIEIKQIDVNRPTLYVMSVKNDQLIYTFSKKQKGKDEWRKITLKAADFKDNNGNPLPDFSLARNLQLNIYPKEPFHPEIGKVSWKN